MARLQSIERRQLWALALGVAAFGVAVGGVVMARRRRRAGPRPHSEAVGGGEARIDETLDESFPASDPPSWSPVVGWNVRGLR